MSNKFTNSCAPISLPCLVGDKVINPCTCRRYFECRVGGYEFLDRGCGLGTAWNHLTGFCIVEDKIFIGNGTPICKKDEPWSPCMSVKDHYSESKLKTFCGTSSQNNGGGGDDEDTDNTAAIVGAVLGVLLVIVIVVGLVFWWKYRKSQKSKNGNLGFRPSLQVKTKEMEEEEAYDVIDEKRVVPVISNTAYGVETEYDNPAFNGKSKTEDNKYTDLHLQHQEPKTSFSQPKEHLSPENSTPVYKRHPNLSDDSSREDLSRSITVGGKEVLVEDCQGYQVGYPSGTIPRQPSPSPGVPDQYEVDYFDDGYNLGKVIPPDDNFELEKTEL